VLRASCQRLTSDCDPESSDGRLPGLVVAQHGVEGGDDFSNASGERDLLVFARLQQTLVEAFDLGVVTRRDHGAQEQRGARVSTATADSTFAAERTTVAVEGGDTGERGDLPTRERAKLRKIADQGAGDGLTDTRHRGEQVALVSPRGVLLEGVLDELFERFDLAIEGLDHAIDAGLQLLGHDLSAVFHHGAKRGELPTAHHQVFDELSFWIGSGMRDGFERRGEASDETGIDLVSLGELPNGAGEATDLQRRDDDDREALGASRPDEGLLEPPGGFDDDALEAVATEAADQRSDGAILVGNAEHSVPLEEIDVERGFADIDTDVHGRTLFCHVYSTLLNSGSGAHSTVRVVTRVDEPLHAC
jgi:hypothetical protein